MDSPTIIPPIHDQPNAVLSSCRTNTRRRKTNTGSVNSPEFEFWKVRAPSFPLPHLLSADELFHDGVLLPLRGLNNQPERKLRPDLSSSSGAQQPTESATGSTTSKRWTNILFKKNDKSIHCEDKRDKKSNQSSGASSVAELNINIWPFSRSKSAGNSVTRPRLFSGPRLARKVSSAPCSRSNSGGESKSRQWPSSPGRAGVHVGRTSPVWQVRSGTGKSGSKAGFCSNPVDKKGVTKPDKVKTTKRVKNKGRANKVLNLNVQTCIGCRHQLSCRSDVDMVTGVGGAGGRDGSGGSRVSDTSDGGNVFNVRSLFMRKVHC